jgi:hypothetical protein
MQTEPAKHPVKIPQPTVSTLVAALFKEVKSAHGALFDLASAGIPGDQIGIAFSAAAQQAQQSEFDLGRHAEPKDEYRLTWRLRHGFEDDLHRRGTEQMSRENAPSMGRSERPYYLVDLHDTLRGIGAAEDRILLVDRALGMHGVLVLVEAGDRAREVQSILEKNCGQIRTDSATERQRVRTH